MDAGLKERTITGVSWSAADAFWGQGVTFLVGLVLARLLTPSEYGLIGICLIFISIINSIIDGGFSSALIRQKNTSNEDYQTMFVTNMVLSIVLYIILYFCSPLISIFFDRPELTDIIRVTGIILILQALSIVQNTILTKRIDFKTKTKASVISSVISGVIGIGMAFTHFGVWALVGQQISKWLLYTVCLWIMSKWWPTYKFSIVSLRYMWGFGWKIMVSSLLDQTWSQLYQVVVGKFYSPSTLGQYTRSREYASLFSVNFQAIIGRVTYPVLAEVQDDKARMLDAYRRIIKVSMFVTAIAMISMGAVSEPLIYCLIGPQWHEAATFLPFICVSLSLYPLHAINLNMLKVQGRSDLFLVLEIIKKIISIGPICLGIFINIYWMLIGSVISGVLSFFINSYYSGRLLNYSSWAQIRDIAPSYGLAILMAVSVYFFKFLPVSNYIILPIQIVIGAVVFFFVCEKWQIMEYVELKKIALKYKSKFKLYH